MLEQSNDGSKPTAPTSTPASGSSDTIRKKRARQIIQSVASMQKKLDTSKESIRDEHNISNSSDKDSNHRKNIKKSMTHDEKARATISEIEEIKRGEKLIYNTKRESRSFSRTKNSDELKRHSGQRSSNYDNERRSSPITHDHRRTRNPVRERDRYVRQPYRRPFRHWSGRNNIRQNRYFPRNSNYFGPSSRRTENSDNSREQRRSRNMIDHGNGGRFKNTDYSPTFKHREREPSNLRKSLDKIEHEHEDNFIYHDRELDMKDTFCNQIQNKPLNSYERDQDVCSQNSNDSGSFGRIETIDDYVKLSNSDVLDEHDSDPAYFNSVYGTSREQSENINQIQRRRDGGSPNYHYATMSEQPENVNKYTVKNRSRIVDLPDNDKTFRQGESDHSNRKQRMSRTLDECEQVVHHRSSRPIQTESKSNEIKTYRNRTTDKMKYNQNDEYRKFDHSKPFEMAENEHDDRFIRELSLDRANYEQCHDAQYIDYSSMSPVIVQRDRKLYKSPDEHDEYLLSPRSVNSGSLGMTQHDELFRKQHRHSLDRDDSQLSEYLAIREREETEDVDSHITHKKEKYWLTHDTIERSDQSDTVSIRTQDSKHNVKNKNKSADKNKRESSFRVASKDSNIENNLSHSDINFTPTGTGCSLTDNYLQKVQTDSVHSDLKLFENIKSQESDSPFSTGHRHVRSQSTTNSKESRDVHISAKEVTANVKEMHNPHQTHCELDGSSEYTKVKTKNSADAFIYSKHIRRTCTTPSIVFSINPALFMRADGVDDLTLHSATEFVDKNNSTLDGIEPNNQSLNKSKDDRVVKSANPSIGVLSNNIDNDARLETLIMPCTDKVCESSRTLSLLNDKPTNNFINVESTVKASNLKLEYEEFLKDVEDIENLIISKEPCNDKVDNLNDSSQNISDILTLSPSSSHNKTSNKTKPEPNSSSPIHIKKKGVVKKKVGDKSFKRKIKRIIPNKRRKTVQSQVSSDSSSSSSSSSGDESSSSESSSTSSSTDSTSSSTSNKSCPTKKQSVKTKTSSLKKKMKKGDQRIVNKKHRYKSSTSGSSTEDSTSSDGFISSKLNKVSSNRRVKHGSRVKSEGVKKTKSSKQKLKTRLKTSTPRKKDVHIKKEKVDPDCLPKHENCEIIISTDVKVSDNAVAESKTSHDFLDSRILTLKEKNTLIEDMECEESSVLNDNLLTNFQPVSGDDKYSPTIEDSCSNDANNQATCDSFKDSSDTHFKYDIPMPCSEPLPLKHGAERAADLSEIQLPIDSNEGTSDIKNKTESKHFVSFKLFSSRSSISKPKGIESQSDDDIPMPSLASSLLDNHVKDDTINDNKSVLAIDSLCRNNKTAIITCADIVSVESNIISITTAVGNNNNLVDASNPAPQSIPVLVSTPAAGILSSVSHTSEKDTCKSKKATCAPMSHSTSTVKPRSSSRSISREKSNQDQSLKWKSSDRNCRSKDYRFDNSNRRHSERTRDRRTKDSKETSVRKPTDADRRSRKSDKYKTFDLHNKGRENDERAHYANDKHRERYPLDTKSVKIRHRTVLDDCLDSIPLPEDECFPDDHNTIVKSPQYVEQKSDLCLKIKPIYNHGVYSEKNDGPISPKRIPLDDRINMVLGVNDLPKDSLPAYDVYDGYPSQYAPYDSLHQPYTPVNLREVNMVEKRYSDPPAYLTMPTSAATVHSTNLVHVTLTESSNSTTVSATKSPSITPAPKIKDILPFTNVLQDVPSLFFNEAKPSITDKINIYKTTVFNHILKRKLQKDKKIFQNQRERDERRLQRSKKRSAKLLRRKDQQCSGEAVHSDPTIIAPLINMDAVCLDTPGLATTETTESTLISTQPRSILMPLGFRSANETSGTSKRQTKSVVFKDGVIPGDGTSPSGGEDMTSPTYTKENGSQKTPRLRKKKTKVKVVKQKPTDSAIDELSWLPPTPPDGSPPPFLRQPMKLLTATICVATKLECSTQDQHADQHLVEDFKPPLPPPAIPPELLHMPLQQNYSIVVK